MDKRAIVYILNELLACEQCSLVVRLLESTVFVPQTSLDDLGIVKRMARAGEEHAAWLSDAILKCGSVPGPRIGDARSADLHFQELRRLRPRLTADRKDLVRKYELAAGRIVAQSDAAEVVSRILERHREELTSLQ
jgi:hypothetical protein